ncbi:MAG: hypothetical protein PHO48_00655 [Candidatus Gracilibacteria bacterium]|nr:hypothetical protein [Candidatus Gracilibacteria bacterium]
MGNIFRPKETPFATITFKGEKLDTTNPLPLQDKPAGEIEIPEGNLESTQTPHRRQGDFNLDEALSAIGLNSIVKEARRFFSGFIELKPSRKFSHKDASGVVKGKDWKIVKDSVAGDTVMATEGYIAVIKYAGDNHAIANSDGMPKIIAANPQVIVFIPNGVSFKFSRSSENGLTVKNEKGKAIVTYEKEATVK